MQYDLILNDLMINYPKYILAFLAVSIPLMAVLTFLVIIRDYVTRP